MGAGRHIADHFGKARGFLLHAALLLSLCLVSIAADAKPKVKKEPEPDRSMQFAIVRGSSQLCEPNCPEWIWAEGEIRADTAKRFKKFLKTVGKRKLPVIIQSPGGDVDAALAMGRLIRANKLDVAVGYTTFSSCAPRQKKCDAAKTGYTGIAAIGFAYCNSACPLVLAGGTRRLVGTWGHLGVHQVTTTMVKEKVLYKTTTRVVNGKKVTRKKVVSRKRTGSYETTKMSKALRRKLETYLAEMGVSADLLEPINKTPASDLLRLDQPQMLALKLITSLDQLEVLTGLTICKAEPAPVNCRVDATAVAKATGEGEAVATKAAAPAAPAKEAAAPPPAAVDPAWTAVQKATENTAMLMARLEAAKDARLRNNARGNMRFVLARASSPLCDPNCPEWISAEGTIVPETPDAFAEFLKTIGGRQLPVVINSKGGDVFGAMAIGRAIRKNGLDAAVGKTHFIHCEPGEEGCKPVEGGYVGAAIEHLGECHAACSLVLAGGVNRYVGYAHVSVRMLAMEARVASYLTEMSIGWRLMDLMRWSMYRPLELDLDTMIDVKLASGPEKVDFLTDPSVCKVRARVPHCRDVTASP